MPRTDRLMSGEPTMKNIVVIGAGKIGSTIARLLAHSGDYQVTRGRPFSAEQLAADREATTPSRSRKSTSPTAPPCVKLLTGKFAVLSAAPYPSDDRNRGSRSRGWRALSRPHRRRRIHPPGQSASRKRPRRPSSRSAASHRASSRSSPTISPAVSTRSTACACASAPCRSTRPTR